MTDQVTVPRELLRQVLKTLTDVWGGYELQHQITDSITELRTALEQPAVEPADLCEQICAAIKAEDDERMKGDYMLDSDDCIRVVREFFAARQAQPAPQPQQLASVPEMHDAKCPALTGGSCECSENPAFIDKPWARFCGTIGRGPDAPYPGMIEAFEQHYSQSFADRDWRNETSVWAAAWKAAKAHTAPPAQTPPPLTDDKRQERALVHAFCLYANLLRTDDAARQAFRSVWVEAFAQGFQCGRVTAPPAQTPVPHGWWIVQSTPEKLNLWPTGEGQLLRIAAPPAQTPVPPRLTEQKVHWLIRQTEVDGDVPYVELVRATETAVRKQAGWE